MKTKSYCTIVLLLRLAIKLNYTTIIPRACTQRKVIQYGLCQYWSSSQHKVGPMDWVELVTSSKLLLLPSCHAPSLKYSSCTELVSSARLFQVFSLILKVDLKFFQMIVLVYCIQYINNLNQTGWLTSIPWNSLNQSHVFNKWSFLYILLSKVVYDR